MSTLLAEGVADPGDLDTPARHHVEQCLRCQAELVQHRKLARALRGLRLQPVETGPELLGDLLDALDEADDQRGRRARDGRRMAYLGGLAAATAAGVGGAFVLARSRRHLAS